MAENEDDSNSNSCAYCKKAIDKNNFIQCSGICNSVYHNDCAQVKESVVNALNACDAIKWYCNECNSNIGELNLMHMLGTIKSTIISAMEVKLNEVLKVFENNLLQKLTTVDKDKISPAIVADKNLFTNLTPNCKSNNIITNTSYSAISKKRQDTNTCVKEGPIREISSKVTKENTAADGKQFDYVVIKAKDSEKDSEYVYSALKNLVNPVEHLINIINIRKIKNGVIVNCASSESKNKLFSELNKSNKKNEFEISEPKKILPKLIVFGIDSNDMPANDKDFETHIIVNNNIDKSVNDFSLSIVRKINQTNGNPGSEVNAILAVDPTTRNSILKHGYLYIGWKRCTVKDSYHTKRCYNCASYGHIKSECTSKVAVCSKCAESHETKLCVSQNIKCANCISFNKQKNQNTNYSHEAGDKHCPCYIRELDKIKARTFFR
ncbi:hypothetical protein RI129_011085 [Pyrocoelia pectoralis]|uniref:CCHC-type domain-containing protein n=1 Tax=Pyrocoelia pectoralis TaxID=417401 RepID=A0AAN7VAI8_9COLE